MVATNSLDDFIPLDRTFHELAPNESGGGEGVYVPHLLGHRNELRWPDLLREYRVILLSEAGSGKTQEIRNIARELRNEGKPSFFVRIEHVTQSFEDAFEEGSFEEFDAWASSGEEGWLLLDSVDEARLRDPKDFERAIRKLGRLLASVLQQAHILISGRTSAWRAKTDRLLCQTALPYQSAAKAVGEEVSADDAKDISVEKVDTQAKTPAPYKIVALDDLRDAQIDAFLHGKNVKDVKAFRDAVDRKEAWSLTTRPQDLSELVEFWTDNQRIGSRLELLQSSIARRLEERDQDRAEARPIAPEKLRQGARLVAAATTLGQESAIRVPDGADNTMGISIRDVLNDWDDKDCSTLLSRPIFDEGIYGTVRFHHRSVREYLTAEWLHALIVDEGSRARIEGLFFRFQYGIDVIVPTMRPVLPWLALLDQRILAHICRLAPEILFEGGDPSQLPRETRRRILRQACEQLAQPAHGGSFTEYGAVQRFANVDLTDDINALLDQYSGYSDVVGFLLRMVWQGEIVGAAARAKHFAIVSRARYPRIAAFRALATVGPEPDQEEVRRAFLVEAAELDRDWLAELIPGTPYSQVGIAWLLDALERAFARPVFGVDKLSEAISELVADLPLALLPQLVAGIQHLMSKAPLAEQHYYKISTRYRWLAQSVAQVAGRLIEARDPCAFELPMLSILRQLPIMLAYDNGEMRDIMDHLRELIIEWSALNHALFWHDVAETRASRDANQPQRLTNYWQVGMFGKLWAFGADAFDIIYDDIASRSLLDDRLIALSLAFSIYCESGRPGAWRSRLKRLANREPELKATLTTFLHPPPRTQSRKQDASWKRQRARALARTEANKQEWKKYLSDNVSALRDPGEPDIVTNAQYYLYQQIREGVDQSNKWSEVNWRSLITEFGEPIAQAVRDGAVNFWRGHRPQLVSEGAPHNSTPFSTIFGLMGLSIEAREKSNWLKDLSRSNAEVATRFALHELNGFPNWFPSLYIAFPDIVINIVMREIEYDLATEDPENKRYNVLYKISVAGDWLWDGLAPHIIIGLHKPPKATDNLRYMLSIVQGSSLDGASMGKLAARHAKTTRNLTASTWFATWVAIDPTHAIPALAVRLDHIRGEANKTQFAMRFITELVGVRRGSSRSQQAYRTVEHMRALYLLLQRYVQEKDDIERTGTGVYTPELRDNAQDARNTLLAFIRETPGKDAFLALTDISRAHLDEASRSWISFQARAKATLDADASAWSPRQVRDFHDKLERTPSNHRDLWYLAVDRLLDLKQDLEQGDSSIASILLKANRETEIRKYIGGWCRERSGGRYVVPQEEELADAKRPDLRFHGVAFDGPVPTELKLAHKYTGPDLFERLEIQLCANYLRDDKSSRGIFLLVYHGVKVCWELPDGNRADNFDALVEALQGHWTTLANQFPAVEDISVIGIDLTKRGVDGETASAKRHQLEIGAA